MLESGARAIGMDARLRGHDDLCPSWGRFIPE